MSEYDLGGGRKLEIVFDTNSPPQRELTEVERWDEWFESTKDEESIKARRVAKATFTDVGVLRRWATIIEINRLDKLSNEKTPPVSSGGV